MQPIIAPSLLSADFLYLAKDCKMLNESQADWYHIDIMDGVFVPNISFGFPIMEAVQKITQKPLDVHLMIQNPTDYIQKFVESGASYISIHYEAVTHLHRAIQQIKNLGAKASVAINPHTPVNHLADIISELDMVLIMSVNPGFGGQKFIKNTYSKVSQTKNLIIQKNSQCLIEVDGGVNLENGKKLVEAGADVLVAGNFVFNSNNPTQTISDLKSIER
jgi:ribulose-phosphate 3-epimerase